MVIIKRIMIPICEAEVVNNWRGGGVFGEWPSAVLGDFAIGNTSVTLTINTQPEKRATQG
jgi:hypothetical protein